MFASLITTWRYMYHSIFIKLNLNMGDSLFDTITHLLKYSMLWQEDIMQAIP